MKFYISLGTLIALMSSVLGEQTCFLECGTIVPHGWRGNEEGTRSCWLCSCNDGRLDCISEQTFCDSKPCEEYCPATSYSYSMDGDLGDLPVIDGDFKIDSGFSTKGNGSLYLDDAEALIKFNNGSQFNDERATPGRITFDWATNSWNNGIHLTAHFPYQICFDMGFASDGWVVNNGYPNGYPRRANAVQFYHVDMRINWLSQSADIYIDGILLQKDAGFIGHCPSGFTSLEIWGSGWVDDMHIWCDDYIAPEGEVAAGVTQSQLRADNLTWSLVLVSTHSGWQPAAQLLGLVAESLVSTSTHSQWDTHRTQLLGDDSVQVNGNRLTITLRAAPNLVVTADYSVRLDLKPEMFINNTMPQMLNEELQFTIRADCVEIYEAFDGDIVYPPSSHKYVTSPRIEGTHALQLVGDNQELPIHVGKRRPDVIEYYARTDNSEAVVRFVVFGEDDTQLFVQTGRGNVVHAMNSPDFNLVQAEWQTKRFAHIVIRFDWEHHTYSVQVDSSAKSNGTLPADFWVESVRFYIRYGSSTYPAYIDGLHMRCD